MQIASLLTGPPPALPDSVAAASVVLHDRSGALSLDQQLGAYQDLAARWRAAPSGERHALARALTESPFAHRVQSTLNAFTRAAWAGSNAAPPEPQAKILSAFDKLSPDDQQIVAALQVDSSGAPAYAGAADYRARLAADLEASQSATRRTDTVTLSKAAEALLAGAPMPDLTPATQAVPERAMALAAYAKAAG